MFSNVKSCGCEGIDGYVMEIETDIAGGIPAFDIVGLGGIAVRESKERVRSAIKNSDLEFPCRHIVVNLAPANIRKEGSLLDLPIALGILMAWGEINSKIDFEKYMFAGELSLDGRVRPVKGILPMVLCAKENGIKSFILPDENIKEASVVKNINIIPAQNLRCVVDYLNGIDFIEALKINETELFAYSNIYDIDFSEVKGQEKAKRALEIAAAGAHNCILIGSQGSGKTMLAKRLTTILPDITFEEAIEITKIYSIAGLLPIENPIITTRPFRSPHHTASQASLAGGGKIPRPGEVSLAHYGVLFLDEAPEFSKETLEVLRQPVEDGKITISRVSASVTFPAKLMLVMAANPCKCGKLFELNGQCTCTPYEIRNYLGRISSPLLDRMDIQVEVQSLKYEEMRNKSSSVEKSINIRSRVNRARKVQLDRYKDIKIFSNSELTAGLIEQFCAIDDQGSALLKAAYETMGLSARAYDRILKVARTIADIEQSEQIKCIHLSEAIQYRGLDRRSWNI